MKHKLLIAAAATALMAAPSLANAQDEGWYLRGNAGYGIHNDSDITGDIVGDVQSEGNATYSVGVGYDFGNNWRGELDYASLFTDMGALNQLPSSFAKLRTNAVMINAIYDFSGFGDWEPYVGAGLGLIDTEATIVAQDYVDSNGNFARGNCTAPAPVGVPRACSTKDSGATLGWQLLAGLGYNISENLVWDTHYRYLDGGSVDFDGVGTQTGSTITTVLNGQMDDIGAHSLMTGFRYKFGAKTPPPPPPPPAPVADYRCWDGSMVFNSGQCPAEPMPVADVQCWDGTMVFDAASCPVQPTYTCWDGSIVYDSATCPAEPVGTNSGMSLVELCGEQFRQEIIYYEFDKGQSAETRNTINRILDVGQFCNVDNIRVVGHTDSSGVASYNLGLSKRRAKDAMDELTRQGVDRNKITSEGKGETELFVQTGDGVKEQLNRRTEVLITLGSIGVMN